MAIVFEVPHALDRFTDGQTEIELAAENVQEALNSTWEKFPELKSRVLNEQGELFPYLTLFHNGNALPRSGFDSIPLQNQDQLTLFAIAAGG